MNNNEEMESLEESMNFGLEKIYPKPTSYRFQSRELPNTPVKEKNIIQIELRNQQGDGTDTNERGKKNTASLIEFH
jgi:hypothetical protein